MRDKQRATERLARNLDLRAERDQLRQQVEKLLGAVDAHRANREQFPKGPSKRNEALWAAADQVRKELEG